MRDIYSNARRTVVYLGVPSGKHCFEAWDELEKNSTWTLASNGQIDYDRPKLVALQSDPKFEFFKVATYVLDRQWLKRVWTYQEAVVSKNLVVQCGSRGVGWDDLCKYVLDDSRHYETHGPHQIFMRLKVDTARNISQARDEYIDAHPIDCSTRTNKIDSKNSILETLSGVRNREASDPRDKIFAVLGVFIGLDLESSQFAIDYSKSCRNVYIDFARDHLREANNYGLLSYVSNFNVPNESGWYDVDRDGRHEEVSRRLGGCLPSWVPDWELSGRNFFFGRTILSTIEPRHLAPRGTVLGEISRCFPILCSAQDEQRFQEVRNRHADDPASLYHEQGWKLVVLI
ncbi:hypothetical protein GGR51DRAFT_524563 [Nemania sp. FL0031]|nr:hypothetical protein GGR51DRAFT_524563 [Nemania sp. FL0031]